MTLPNTDRARCVAQKGDGSPCRVTMGLDPVSGLCIVHDPARRDELRDRQAKGRAARGAEQRRKPPAKMPPMPQSLEDAVRFASWLTWAVLVGEIDARTCESSTKALRQFQLGEEKRALQDEVKKLRAELADARKGRRIA